MELQDLYSPPKADVQLAQNPLSVPVVLAGRGRRLAAALLDSLVLFLPVLAVVFVIQHFSLEILIYPVKLWTNLLLSAVASLLWLLINYAWLGEGQTVGKKIMKIRMVHFVTGQVPDRWTLGGIRYAFMQLVFALPLGVLLALIDLLMIFRKDRRCLHDLVAKTKVVMA